MMMLTTKMVFRSTDSLRLSFCDLLLIIRKAYDTFICLVELCLGNIRFSSKFFCLHYYFKKVETTSIFIAVSTSDNNY